jgi:hypothetical protein
VNITILTGIGLVALGLISSEGALASPMNMVTLDWGSLQVQLTDLDPTDGITPAINWVDQSTTTTAYGGGAPAYQSSTDWTTVLLAADGSASASADAATLEALAVIGDADVSRTGEFMLTANTQAVFALNADTFATSGNTADASLFIVGGDTGYDLAHLGPVGSGSLSVTFVNAIASNADGFMGAEGTVSAAIPEPETNTLMVAGMGLLSFFARRRRI